VFYDDIRETYYIYSTDAGPGCDKEFGGQIRYSKDLIHFNYLTTALRENIPDEVREHTKAETIWAPDIIKYKDEYRLYYSASTFGSQYSAIGLAISDSPEGPFLPREIVIKTTPESPVNAIDANIVTDHITGQQYMVYGSFWDGIRLLRLNSETGLADEEGYGIRIASRPKESVDGAIEGPYIRYNNDTGYYYLFVSYESLSNHYNVRVGRSKGIAGPYLDFNGRDMLEHCDTPYDIGLKITSGYSFKPSTGWIAFGHNSVINRNGDWYLVCHARYESNQYLHNLHVHKMFWTKEGWPVVSPLMYAGEYLQTLSTKDIIGNYARIDFQNDVSNLFLTPQTFSLQESGICELSRNGNLIHGTWELDQYKLMIKYDMDSRPIVEEHFIIPSWDYEENKGTLAFTGMDQYGHCSWGKKI
jgi:arabinan endo-1,5-alpha-L-arabinosidase